MAGFAVARVDAAAVGIEREFRVNQIAMIAQQPFDAVGLSGFLVGGQHENNVAIRTVILLREGESARRRKSRRRISCPACRVHKSSHRARETGMGPRTIPPAALRPRRDGPSEGSDVARRCRAAAQPDFPCADWVRALARRLRENPASRRRCAIASAATVVLPDRIGRIDFDELLENIARELAVRVIASARPQRCRQSSETGEWRAVSEIVQFH